MGRFDTCLKEKEDGGVMKSMCNRSEKSPVVDSGGMAGVTSYPLRGYKKTVPCLAVEIFYSKRFQTEI